MLALTPVKKSTALLQTTITFVPSLRLGYFFVLIAAEFDRLSGKLSRRERVAFPVARCCVDCRRFLACFCLYHRPPNNHCGRNSEIYYDETTVSRMARCLAMMVGQFSGADGCLPIRSRCRRVYDKFHTLMARCLAASPHLAHTWRTPGAHLAPCLAHPLTQDLRTPVALLGAGAVCGLLCSACHVGCCCDEGRRLPLLTA